MSNDENESKLTVALEERKIIQTIIESQESIRMKLVGWCITTISALTIAFHSKTISFSNTKYGLFSFVIILVFLLNDIVNRKVFITVVRRSCDVEKMIRDDIRSYDGPKIEESLQKASFKDIHIIDIRLLSPYLSLTIIAAISYFAKIF